MQNSYVLMKIEQTRQNGIGARGATNSERAQSTIGEQSEPTNGGGAPETRDVNKWFNLGGRRRTKFQL